MKKTSHPGTWIFLILVSLAFSAPAFPGDPLVWATDDTPGGHYITGGGNDFHKEKPGIEIELYRMVARDLGLDVRLKRMPWNRCLTLIEQNRVDGIFPASFKPSRLKIGVFPMIRGKVDSRCKTRNNAYFLYTLDRAALDWNGKHFTKVTGPIGVPLGWSIAEDLKDNGLPIRELDMDEKIPNLLIHKRLDGFICLETVFDAYLNRSPDYYKGIVKVRPPIREKPYYLMLSHQFVETQPETAQKIWAAIREIKGSYRFTRLVNKYLE